MPLRLVGLLAVFLASFAFLELALALAREGAPFLGPEALPFDFAAAFDFDFVAALDFAADFDFAAAFDFDFVAALDFAADLFGLGDLLAILDFLAAMATS